MPKGRLKMSDPHDREPIDQATIDCWRTNYGLDKRTPAQAARYWSEACAGMAPAGAVAALGVALDELDAERKDAERYRWLAARLLAADFDYNGEGVQALVFELPAGCAVSADCNATIDAAMLAALAVGTA